MILTLHKSQTYSLFYFFKYKEYIILDFCRLTLYNKEYEIYIECYNIVCIYSLIKILFILPNMFFKIKRVIGDVNGK